LLDTEYWILGTRDWIMDTGYQIMHFVDIVYWILDTGYRILYWILGSGYG
jgi:hypothetical protein